MRLNDKRPTPSKIPKAANIAFPGGSGCGVGVRSKAWMKDFRRTRATASPRAVLEESVNRTWTARFIGLMIFP